MSARESAVIARNSAREAAQRVREVKKKNELAEAKNFQQRMQRKLELHLPKPMQRQRVPENETAGQFSIEQQRLNALRQLKIKHEREEWEQQQLNILRQEATEEEERRLQLKREQLENSKKKKEENQSHFLRTGENVEAARRASQFRFEHPELVRVRSKSVTPHPRRYSCETPVLPGTKDAVDRIKRFKKIEDDRKQREQQQLEELKKQKQAHHKENMLNLRRQRSRSCSRDSQMPTRREDFHNSRSLELKLEDIKKRIAQLKSSTGQ
jgi:hypothetical protein